MFETVKYENSTNNNWDFFTSIVKGSPQNSDYKAR